MKLTPNHIFPWLSRSALSLELLGTLGWPIHFLFLIWGKCFMWSQDNTWPNHSWLRLLGLSTCQAIWDSKSPPITGNKKDNCNIMYKPLLMLSTSFTGVSLCLHTRPPAEVLHSWFNTLLPTFLKFLITYEQGIPISFTIGHCKLCHGSSSYYKT